MTNEKNIQSGKPEMAAITLIVSKKAVLVFRSVSTDAANNCVARLVFSTSGFHRLFATKPGRRRCALFAPGFASACLHENISVYSVLSAPSSPCSRSPICGPPGGTVFCGSAVDSFAPDGGFFRSEHKLQPSRFTEVSISIA
jgi:hypothetical protein